MSSTESSNLRSLLLWDIGRRTFVVDGRRFGTCRSHLQRSSRLYRRCPEMAASQLPTYILRKFVHQVGSIYKRLPTYAARHREKALASRRHFSQVVISQEGFCSMWLVTETATRSRWRSGYNWFFLFRRTCVQIPTRKPTNQVLSVSSSQILYPITTKYYQKIDAHFPVHHIIYQDI